MPLEDGEYVGITLWITSLTLAPKAISLLIGLEPTYVQIQGTAVGGTSRVYERHSWSLGERLYAGQDEQLGSLVEPFISRFLDSLAASGTKIRALSADHSVSLSIIFGVWNLPYLGLTREQVEAVATLGASVNYDVMTYAAGR